MTTRKSLTIDRISSDAVRRATGRGWEEWLDVLDRAGAGDWNHKEIVAYLEREHPSLSGWWRQSVTVGYEKARGKRADGETADAGFQLGVQRSVGSPAARVWKLIVDEPQLWLGEGAAIEFRVGERYRVPAGKGSLAASGEIRVAKPGARLRMTWQPRGWPAPATLQLALTETGTGKTAIRLHMEKLPDAEAREAMRVHWRTAVDRIAAALSGG
jgi:uncharacterized protein YndB with AHSA1/START domain